MFLRQVDNRDVCAFPRIQDGNGTPNPDMDNWPAVFEWAAQTWSDPTFRWAAQTEWGMVMNGTRLPLNEWLMTYAVDWTNSSLTPTQPSTASALLTRNANRTQSAAETANSRSICGDAQA